MPNTEVVETELKLALIAGHATREPDLQFTSLAHLLNREFLEQYFTALKEVRR